LVQFESEPISQEELDSYFDFDFKRDIPPNSPSYLSKFSIISHKGCFGNCSFCSISLIQGQNIVSRSVDSILKEIERIKKHKDFDGIINDLTAASSNMYGLDCKVNLESIKLTSVHLNEKKDHFGDLKCLKENCINCLKLKKDIENNDSYLNLLRTVRSVSGVKKVIISSGLRYDLLLKNKEILKELMKYHLIGWIKIAPEHIDSEVLGYMNKPANLLDNFMKFFSETRKELVINDLDVEMYVMVGHPGDNIEKARNLGLYLKPYVNNVRAQIFIPTPLTNSTAMYYSGYDLNLKKIHIPYTYNEKKILKRLVYNPYLKV
jgi:uncharacterized radical SAM protein YgiQ